MRTKLAPAAAVPLLAALALAPPAAALDVAYFQAKVSGQQITTWSEPVHDTTSNCQGTRFYGAEGEHRISFTGSAKVTAIRHDNGAITWNFGAFSLADSPKSGLTGSGSVSREASETGGIRPGPCASDDSGSDGAEQPTGCGSRPAKVITSVGFAKGRLSINPIIDVKGRPFGDCPVFGHDAWLDAPSRSVKASMLFARRATVQATGGDVVSDSRGTSFGGTLKTRTSVQWRLNLRRVQP